MSAHHESDDSVNNADARPVDDVPVERPEDDDYDLLTFGEAGARLAEEVALQQRRVDQLRVDGAAEDQVRAAEGRLVALQQAQLRNRKPTIDELRESGFFGRRS